MNREQWLERERQWQQFHEWEAGQTSTSSFASRLQWFCEVWEIGRRYQGNGSGMPTREKIERIRLLKEALARIKAG